MPGTDPQATDIVEVTYMTRVTWTLDTAGRPLCASVERPEGDFLDSVTTYDGATYQTSGDTALEVDANGDPLTGDAATAAGEVEDVVTKYDLTGFDTVPIRFYGDDDASRLEVRLGHGVDVEWGEVLGDFFDHTGMVTVTLNDGTEIPCELVGISRVEPDWFEAVTVNVFDPEVGHDTVVDTRPIRIDTIAAITI